MRDEGKKGIDHAKDIENTFLVDLGSFKPEDKYIHSHRNTHTTHITTKIRDRKKKSRAKWYNIDHD